jgi:multimeric flavodoxin WrbA
LDGKAVGSIAVGAKRNGGQETTNVFALFDCISLGACVVGNGPPTSQYGGTAVGGGMGAIIDDAFGLKTSRGTGQRVALLARTMALDPAGTEDKFRIVFLVTRTDREGYFIDKIKNLPFSAATQVEVVDITQMKIARCRACSVCPNGNLKDAYTCVIPPLSGSGRRDDMQKIHRFMAPADIIILAHYNGPNAGVDHYQVFMERTRFIRRNQFELTNRVFSAFYETHCSPDIFTLRGLSSFLRHNMFLVGPFYCAFRQSGAICFESVDTKMYVARLETMARKARMARALGYNTIETSYLPVGYPGEKK